MAWYQRNNLNKFCWFFVKIFLKTVFIFFILYLDIFLLNFHVNCTPLKYTKEYLKEIHHEGKILICSNDLSECAIRLNYNNNYEHFYKLSDKDQFINYKVSKYFYLVNNEYCSFPKNSPLSHYNLNLRFHENIYLNVYFTHKIPNNNFSLITKDDLLNNRKPQYISDIFYFYSNNFIPRYYNLNYLSFNLKNNSDINTEDAKKIQEYVDKYNEHLLKHIKKSFGFNKDN